MKSKKSVHFKNKFPKGEHFPIPIHFSNDEFTVIVNTEYLKEMFKPNTFDEETEKQMQAYTLDDN